MLIFAPVFAWIWISLGERGRDPSAGAKFGLGLLQLGLSFLVMMVAAQVVLRTGARVLPGWLILTYLLQTTGELCLSPIGLSNVTKLAPSRYSSQMMGTWFLGAAIGNLAAGLIGGEVASSRGRHAGAVPAHGADRLRVRIHHAAAGATGARLDGSRALDPTTCPAAKSASGARPARVHARRTACCSRSVSNPEPIASAPLKRPRVTTILQYCALPLPR